MQPSTGDIHYIAGETKEDYIKNLQSLETKLKEKLIPLTEEQVKILKPLSKRKRKFLMKNGSCICGSGKSFKKCCWKKYK